jgi:hypothetical protein
MVQIKVVLVAALVVFAGCSGFGGQSNTGDVDAGMERGDGGDGGGDSAPSSGDGGNGGSGSEQKFGASGSADGQQGEPAQLDRALVKTGQMTVEVENFSTARAAVTDEARALGGYVSASDATLHRSDNATWRTGYVEVRVPTSNFTAIFESTRGQGTVLTADSETKDVTDQLVDLNARLENLRAQRDQLRSLYETANTTEGLLSVQERLSNVQQEIERLEANRRSLRDRVAFSTLRVELREPEPEPESEPVEEEPAFHEQSPEAVFLSSLSDFVTFGRTVLIASVAALPWVLGLGVPLLVVLGVLRRRRSLPSVPFFRR